MATTVFAIGFFGALFTFAVVVMILQAFLSRVESKWAGIIMPTIMVGISILASFNFAMRLINTRSFTGIINGIYIEHTTSIASIILQTALIFVLCNIVTGILIAIYTIFRRKINRRRALEMMSIQDLG